MGALTEELPKQIGALRDGISSFPRWNPEGLQSLVPVVQDVLERASESMRRVGAVPFARLLRGTRDLLVARPDIAQLLRSRMDQLLVDEFQDTNAIQCDVVRILALSGPMETRPGLFLVGDPKQSIYGWRQADLRAYNGFVEEILALGGTKSILSVNYRSTPTILREVERVHGYLMNRTPDVSPPSNRYFHRPTIRGQRRSSRRIEHRWNIGTASTRRSRNPPPRGRGRLKPQRSRWTYARFTKKGTSNGKMPPSSCEPLRERKPSFGNSKIRNPLHGRTGPPVLPTTGSHRRTQLLANDYRSP